MINDDPTNIIYGRLAEAIIEEIFKRSGYIIYHHGYEYRAENFNQQSDWNNISSRLKTIEKSPDFVVRDNTGQFMFFLEVKFRTDYNQGNSKYIKEDLKEYLEDWPNTVFCIVTPHKPYFTALFWYENKWIEVELKNLRKAEKLTEQVITPFEELVERLYKNSQIIFSKR